jgi:hypothetical protein
MGTSLPPHKASQAVKTGAFDLGARFVEGAGLRRGTSIGVLGGLAIKAVRVNGIDRTEQLKPNSVNDFQVRLAGREPNTDDGSVDLVVEFAVH